MSSVLNEEEKLLLEAMQSDSPVAKDKTQKQQQNTKKKAKDAKKQVKAQEKLKGIKRPHQLNNDRSDHASTVEEFETGSCKVRAPKARKNLKFK